MPPGDCAKLRLAGTVHRCLSQTEKMSAWEWKLNRIRKGAGDVGILILVLVVNHGSSKS